ncbi:MAG: hypothetical protein WAM14_05095 [Candidatus Nitrosopolaris sp.]
MKEKQFVIEVNLRLRHLNEFQLGELGYILEDIERELGKRREKNHNLHQILVKLLLSGRKRSVD